MQNQSNIQQFNIQKYKITGMHCGSCVAKVKAALAPYAEHVEVSLDPAQAILTNSSVDISTLQNAVSQAGKYNLLSIMLEPVTQGLEVDKSWLETYHPLLLIIGYILICTGAIQLEQQLNLKVWMAHFMAGFFLTFSFFKLLDLKSFANSYAMYDLLAMRWQGYAYIYPFIELGLGLAYILYPHAKATNLVAFVIMLFSSIGVIIAVMNKQKIRCACLGSVFNLPMTTVTIIEDLSMATMAALMLV